MKCPCNLQRNYKADTDVLDRRASFGHRRVDNSQGASRVTAPINGQAIVAVFLTHQAPEDVHDFRLSFQGQPDGLTQLLTTFLLVLYHLRLLVD